jgi:hypothetical protein
MMLNWIRRGVLVLILAGSLYASIQSLISTKTLGSMTDDPVADWEHRFAPLKKQLPFVRGVVGYISDSSIPGFNTDPANDSGEYVLTQYVMAPIIIVNGTDQEWNIANLSPQAYKAWSPTNNGRFDVTAFGGGIYLLHRIAP